MTGLELNRLRPSVLWRETEEGVLVELGRRSFVMRGKKAYTVVARLLPLFDGSWSLREIRGSVPEPLHSMLDRLVEELTDRNMLTSGGPVAAELSDFSDELVRLAQDRCDDWQGALLSWANRSVTIVAPDKLSQTIERYCADLGVHSTRMSASEVEGSQLDGSLLIWLATNLPDALKAGDVEDADGAVGAVMRGPLAAIVTGDGENLGHLPDLFRKCPDLEESLGEIAVTGFCGLLVYQALQVHMRKFQDPHQSKGGSDELRLFRRDGSVHQIELDLALHSSSSFDADRGYLAEIPTLEPTLAPLFDSDLQLMSWADDQEKSSPFPLLHRSIALSSVCENGDPEKIISEWGLTPEEADRRTIRAALIAVADGHYGTGPTDGYSPTVAASDEAEAVQIGRAHLLAQKCKLWDSAAKSSVDLARDCDPDLGVMVRLARLVGGGTFPQLYLASDPQQVAFVATVQLSGLSVSRLGASGDKALYDAIGELLSASQRGLPVYDQLPEFGNISSGSCTFVPSDALDFGKYGFVVGRVRYD